MNPHSFGTPPAAGTASLMQTQSMRCRRPKKRGIGLGKEAASKRGAHLERKRPLRRKRGRSSTSFQEHQTDQARIHKAYKRWTVAHDTRERRMPPVGIDENHSSSGAAIHSHVPVFRHDSSASIREPRRREQGRSKNTSQDNDRQSFNSFLGGLHSERLDRIRSTKTPTKRGPSSKLQCFNRFLNHIHEEVMQKRQGKIPRFVLHVPGALPKSNAQQYSGNSSSQTIARSRYGVPDAVFQRISEVSADDNMSISVEGPSLGTNMMISSTKQKCAPKLRGPQDTKMPHGELLSTSTPKFTWSASQNRKRSRATKDMVLSPLHIHPGKRLRIAAYS